MEVLLVITWILLVLSALGLVYWLIVLWRVGRVLLDRPTVRRGLSLDAPENGWPTLSIIVPVHNEQRVIDDCCSSLRAQDYERLEIIFVLDRCEDQSLAILRRHAAEDDRITLIENEECPSDWAGKCHAARLGAEKAHGDWLLFTDADTVFDPNLSQASLALANHQQLSLLSLLSTLTFKQMFEYIVQPVATLNLIRMYPMDRVNRAESGRTRPFANGQFMLFPREDYDRISGHTGVKDELLEDIAFARLMHENNGRCGVFLADGMLTCSMYDSLADMRRGWKRIFVEACKRKPGRLMKNARRVIFSGIVLPLIQILALVAAIIIFRGSNDPGLGILTGSIVLAGWLVQFLALRWIYHLGGAPHRACIFYPLGSWEVARIMFDGARDLKDQRPIQWADRDYVRQVR